jgi:hypothetical protein
MKKCPGCENTYSDSIRFCPNDGTKLQAVEEGGVKPANNSTVSVEGRPIPPPPQPLRMRMTIIDQSDEGHRSRIIQGQVLDVGSQGMRIKTGTIETGHLNIIRDDTVAFKNKLEIEIDLPEATVKLEGFAVWYKPEVDGITYTAGVYIRGMSSTDRRIYERYLNKLESELGSQTAPANA